MSILLENVTKRYEQQIVVNNVSLEIKDGEFFVLLGSSGSGKTTVLNIIAGLASAEQGRVLLHGRDVTNLPTQKRNIGFVFQNYALFEYMTVAENIEFGLQIRKVHKKERQLKRDELLELVGLVGLGDRMPRQLSGGQQQRVALARALVLEPDVLLLDEPLGALDAKIRVDLRRSLKNIQKQLGVAAILVTHDQEEAFDLADRIGVMSYGRLVEVGTPQELYQRPKTEFVASFLGTANILLGQTEGERIQIGPHIFKLAKDATRFSTDGRVQVVFRPEDLALVQTEEELDCTPLGEGTVTSLGFNGPTERIRLELPSIRGVRAIAPSVPFGSQNILIEATRSPDQASAFPLGVSDKAWVGIRRIHALSHPGLNFLVLTDGSLRSQSALSVGSYLARMAHARMTLLGVGKDETLLDTYLQDARKQLGSGMASIEVRTDPLPAPIAITKIIEKDPVDLAIVGWRPVEGTEIAEQILRHGDHNLLLAAHPGARIEKALVCVASGEPGKDDVMFAGRLLRHLGASAKLFTVLTPAMNNEHQNRLAVRFVSGGVQTLEMFGVPTESELKVGDPLTEISEEIKRGAFDLVVMGSPFPQKDGRILLHGLIEGVMKNAGDCSVLIVRSHHHKNTIKQNWSESLYTYIN
ncbi:MAG TPA: ATP-binding cassette domain-containing protein [Anaerolineales bacterium]|nr:ATP-binding cassette domain-containing protein [Anaerolineales bacterium]